jgi:hypothetical protein
VSAPCAPSSPEMVRGLQERVARALPAEHVERFFSTISTFGTALDITIAELAIESFFPADAATTDALASQGGHG